MSAKRLVVLAVFLLLMLAVSDGASRRQAVESRTIAAWESGASESSQPKAPAVVDWEHNNNHIKVWNNNLKNAHRSIDLYAFGYDWNDPTIPGLSYEEEE